MGLGHGGGPAVSVEAGCEDWARGPEWPVMHQS